MQTSSLAATSSGCRPGRADRARGGRRVGRVAAVLLQVVPGLVLGDALIHPVRLDQSQERLARKRELVDGRRERPHDRPGRLARVAGAELLLQLVERGQAIALDLVPEHVDEPGETVDGAQVRPEAARERAPRQPGSSRSARGGLRRRLPSPQASLAGPRWSTGHGCDEGRRWFNHVAPHPPRPSRWRSQSQSGRAVDRPGEERWGGLRKHPVLGVDAVGDRSGGSPGRRARPLQRGQVRSALAESAPSLRSGSSSI